ncbi:hypothetical protein C2E23DRAFT_884548 [Lenzites betulinus]|nr:hypothetical protein C2E23DRAFT_884548 [Lenzites betulinus]
MSYTPPSPTQIVREASHELLLHNHIYQFLLAQHSELIKKNDMLQQNIGELRGRYDQGREMCDTILARISPISGASGACTRETTAETAPPEPQPDLYPNITFWTRESWTPYQQHGDKHHLRHNAHNVRIYLQHADGSVISKGRLTEMSEFQRHLWEKYRNERKLPEKWSQAGSDIVSDHRQEMYRNFPELSLCEGHYKLALFASERYSSWIRSRALAIKGAQRAVSIKEEPINEPHIVRVPKRACPPTVSGDVLDERPAKRANVEGSRREQSLDYAELILPTPDVSPIAPLSILANPARARAFLKKLDDGEMESVFAASPTSTATTASSGDPATVILRGSPIVPVPIGDGDGVTPMQDSADPIVWAPPMARSPASASLGTGPPMSASLANTKVPRLRISKASLTARNLTAIGFAKKHPNPTVREFNTWWEAMSHEDVVLGETRHRFAQAHAAKWPDATAYDIYDAFNVASEADLQPFREAAITKMSKQKASRKGKEKAV